MSTTKRLRIAGGTGFVGTNFAHYLVATGQYTIINVDKLTYARNLQSLAE